MRKGCNGGEGVKNDENSGHYVITSSQPPKRRPLERRMLVPIIDIFLRRKYSQEKEIFFPFQLKIAKTWPKVNIFNSVFLQTSYS